MIVPRFVIYLNNYAKKIAIFPHKNTYISIRIFKEIMTNGITATTNFIVQKIDKNMVNAVTDAIFQRAAAKGAKYAETPAQNNTKKAAAYNTDIYKTSVQNEVMEEARKSLTQAANPFAAGLFNTESAKNVSTAAAASSNVSETNSKAISGNALRTNNRTRVNSSIALQNSMFTAGIRESMMIQAKEQIANNNDLMSRLQFLNAKTAVGTYPAARF